MQGRSYRNYAALVSMAAIQMNEKLSKAYVKEAPRNTLFSYPIISTDPRAITLVEYKHVSLQTVMWERMQSRDLRQFLCFEGFEDDFTSELRLLIPQLAGLGYREIAFYDGPELGLRICLCALPIDECGEWQYYVRFHYLRQRV